MDRKDRKGGDKLFLHNLSICSQYLKEKVIVLSFIISIFHLEDSYTLGYSVLHQVIGFLKWVVNPFKMYVFFFFHPVYRSGIQLFNNHNPENREPSFNYLVMFSGTVGHFDKNRTLVKLTNCEKNCHISHILFSKHLL